MQPARDDLPDLSPLEGSDAILSALLDQDPATRRTRLLELRESDPARADSLAGMLATLDEFGLLAEPPASTAHPARIGPFRIVDVLGHGGMGAVYLAEQDGLQRRIALKVIHGAMAQSPRLRERFRREAIAASRLEHPAICPVYEIGETDGTPWIAMRFVSGSTLARRLAQAQTNGAPPSRDDAARLIAALADGVHAAHESGLVHRDIKPGNILLDGDGKPVLVDFGLASLDDEDGARLTRTGDFVGTPHYMTPEQIRGGPVDRRCDVYALGVVLYECLTLRTPFDAVNRESLFQQILRDEPEDPRRRNRLLDRDTVTVLQTALAKDPEQRYRTAAMFADDLRRLLAHQPIRARRAGVLLRLRRFAQRNPMAAGFVAFLLVAVGAFAVLLRENTRALARASANEQALRANEHGVLAPVRGLQRALAAVQQNENLDTTSALQQAVQRHRVAAVLAHDGVVWCARFSPQGDRIVTCGEDHTARLWHRDGRPIVALPHSAGVFWAEWSPTGDCFVTAAGDGRARLFDRDGHLLHRLDHGWAEHPGDALLDPGAGRWVNRARFAPDGRHVATSCSDHRVRVWDVTTGARVHEWVGAERFIELAWSPDGSTVAVFETENDMATDHTPFRVLCWRRGQVEPTPAMTLTQERSINEIDWSPDSTQLLTCARDGTVRVYEMRGGAEVLRLKHAANVSVAHFSANGARILTSCEDHVVRLWDRELRVLHEAHCDVHPRANFLHDGRIVVTYVGPGIAVFDGDLGSRQALRGQADVVYHAPDLSPDGTQLVSASWDGTAVVWQLFDPALPRLPVHTNLVMAMTNLPDGRIASVGEDRRLCITDLATGRSERHAIAPAPTSVLPNADASKLVVAHNGFHGEAEVRVHEVRSGAPIAHHAIWGLDVAAMFLPGDRLLTVAHGGPNTNQPFVRELVAAAATPWGKAFDYRGVQLAWSRQREQVAIGGFNRRLHVRDAAGTEIGWWRAHDAWVCALAFDPSGQRLASASRDGTARVWDMQRWVGGASSEAPPSLRLIGHEGRVHTVTWSHDGRHVATAGSDGSVRLWNAATGEAEFVVRSDAGTAGCVLFTSDDRFLLTGGLDGTIEAWPTERARLLELAQRDERRALPSTSSVVATVPQLSMVLVDRKGETAARLSRELLARGIAEGDGRLLDNLAWRLGQGPVADVQDRNLDVALRAAQEAVRLTDGKYWSAHETLAVVHAARGELAAAVEAMRKCVALVDHADLRERLAKYEARLARGK